VIQNFYLEKSCYVNFQLNASECNAQHNHTSETDSEHATEIQKYVSNVNIYGSFIENIPSIIFVLFLIAGSIISISGSTRLEDHRRRGYAALVIQYLSKRIAQSGLIPFVIINHQIFLIIGRSRPLKNMVKNECRDIRDRHDNIDKGRVGIILCY
jgi:hypothetical protein